ncbi:hypothetical protein [Bernardetia sp.]|uniref:hypothetical protein n=1 Tax=Bernardetia sp. TaxID=1937974 RepID=UPI0025B973BD|nr:hypothetical protein [Bernardetia sp.]
MKKNAISLVLWILVIVVSIALAYDVFSRKQVFEQSLRLVEQSNNRLSIFFNLYHQDKNKIGYFKTNWSDVKGDSLRNFRSMEYAYDKSQSLRERIGAFREEMILSKTSLSDKDKPLFLSQDTQGLLKDSLNAYDDVILDRCQDCNLGSYAYSQEELALWNLESTLPIIWNTALMTLEAKTWLLQHQVIDFNSKPYMNDMVRNFPYNNGEIYVKPEFRVVEEGKTYNAEVLYGMSVPMLYSYLSMQTDFQKVPITKEGEGRVLFITWTNNYDESGEFHKNWEGDIYIVKDFMLLDNTLQFKDTTLNVEADYVLIRDMY